jgi:hypothetical protein
MQWIYGTGFPTDERETWRTIIYDNLMEHTAIVAESERAARSLPDNVE